MIRLENITKKFDHKVVIDNISLSFEKGEFIVFLGASGCGKTTTLKMINKLIPMTKGRIYVDNVNIEKINTTELRRKIGYVIQSMGLFPHMTILDNITIILKLQHLKEEERYQRAKELVTMIKLDEEVLKKYPDELSGGQKQRIGFARALANNPEIILMDEPFSALDPITRTQLQDEIVEIQKKLQKTIVFVTHSIDEALRIADRICIFENGKVVQFASPQEILNSPANEYVKSFVGEEKLWQNPNYIPINEIMLAKAVTIPSNANMVVASRRMRNSGVDTLLVVDNENRYIGLIEMEQLLQTAVDALAPVSSFCSTKFTTLLSDAMVDEAITIMIDGQQKLIPIVDSEEKLQGVVTRAKLFNKIGAQFIENSLEMNHTEA